MKKIILALAISGIALVSCKKTENPTESITPDLEAKSSEVSNVQDTKTLTNSKGEKLKVTYYAEGTDVMVKIQKNNEPEYKLSPKTVTSNGNPVFSNEVYMWEMKEGNAGGKLTDKDGNAMEYMDTSAE